MIWSAFKKNFTQAYRHYLIRNKITSAAHGYGSAENYAQEIYAQMIMVDALKELSNATIEDK